MQIKSIRKTIFRGGQAEGTPTLLIEFDKNKGDGNLKTSTEMSFNEIIEKVRGLGLNNITVKGSVYDVPEIKDIVVGLYQIGGNITVITNASEDIEVFRILPKLSFFIKVKAPTGDESDIKSKMFPLLKQIDTVEFEIKNKKDYENVKEYLKSRVVTLPEIVFYLADNFDKDELKDFLIIYLKDCNNFSFRNRLGNFFALLAQI